MARKNDEQDNFFRNLEEIHEEDSATDSLNMEKDEVDRTIPFFARVLHSTPIKARPNPSAVKSNPNRRLSQHLSHSEGDLSTSIGNLDISVDERSPQKKRARQSTEIDEATYNRLETPIYCKNRLSNQEILGMLTDTASIDQTKVCSKIPVAPPAIKDPFAGNKPGIRRRGTMESAGTKKNDNVQLVIQRRTVPPISISDRLQIPIPTPQELIELELPKTFYKYPYHNDQHFVLVLLKDYKRTYPGTKEQCKSCANALSTRDIAPNNAVFVHYERYWVPATRISEGYYTMQRLRPTLIHFAYHCLKNRYSYISSDLLRKDPLLILEPEYEQLMEEQFGIANFQPAVANWRNNPFR